MTPSQAARLIWIHGGKTIDPRTATYFVQKIKRAA